MITIDQIKQLSVTSKSKIVMLVIDGLGGLPDPRTGRTELETAATPNLDHLARSGICGLSTPISPGITPGSGPGHLALFGYDPFKFVIGRGVLEGLGIGFELKDNDLAARGNFCTVNSKGIITDRRAGRITTDKCAELCEVLSHIELEGTEIFVSPVREHRFLLVLRGGRLAAELRDTDPQETGAFPNRKIAEIKQAEDTANIVNTFVDKAAEVLASHHPANMILLRGFSRLPKIPSLGEIYKLKPAAIASYPMYKGIARLLGMKVFEADNAPSELFATLSNCYKENDFFFIHVKGTDSAGEDGDFGRKVRIIEEVDIALAQLLDLKPDVIVVTGDHSTPALLKGHSWHPVPFLLYSQWCRPDSAEEFSESACASGSLSRFSALDIMPLAMANALKLTKFGA